MKNPKDGFLIGRAKSFRYAFAGAYLLLKTEHSVITQFSLAVLSVIIGFLFHITKNGMALSDFIYRAGFIYRRSEYSR
jgi:diacylglycerol kinase (ATP)